MTPRSFFRRVKTPRGCGKSSPSACSPSHPSSLPTTRTVVAYVHTTRARVCVAYARARARVHPVRAYLCVVRARVDGRARTPAQTWIISAHAPVDCRVGGKADIAGGVSKPFRPCREFSTAWFLVAVGGRSCTPAAARCGTTNPGGLRIARAARFGARGCGRVAEISSLREARDRPRVLFHGKLVYRARARGVELGLSCLSERKSVHHHGPAWNPR